MNFYQQKYFKPYHELVTSPQHLRPQSQYRTPSTHKYHKYKNPQQRVHYTDRYTPQPIWDHLYNKGRQNLQKQLKRHEETKHKIDVQCTFKPMIKQNKRYLIPSHSTFLQRNNVWMQNKIQKIVKQKQEQINKDLKQCTFSPIINKNSKKTKPQKYDYKIHKQNCPNQKLHKSAIKSTMNNKYIRQNQDQNEQFYTPPVKKNTIQIAKAKQMIRNELKRLVL